MVRLRKVIFIAAPWQNCLYQYCTISSHFSEMSFFFFLFFCNHFFLATFVFRDGLSWVFFSVAEKPALIPLLLSKLSSKLKGQSQKQSQSPPPSTERRKLVLKVILVAVAAVACHFLLNDTWNFYWWGIRMFNSL